MQKILKQLVNCSFILFICLAQTIFINPSLAKNIDLSSLVDETIELKAIAAQELVKASNPGNVIDKYPVKIAVDGELSLNNFAHNEVFTTVKVYDSEQKLLDEFSGHVVNLIVPVKAGDYEVQVSVSAATDYTLKFKLTGLNGDLHPDTIEGPFAVPLTFKKGKSASGAYINFKEDIDFVELQTPYSGSLFVQIFNLGSFDSNRSEGEVAEFTLYDSEENEIAVFGEEGIHIYLEEGLYYIGAKGPLNSIFRILYSI